MFYGIFREGRAEGRACAGRRRMLPLYPAFHVIPEGLTWSQHEKNRWCILEKPIVGLEAFHAGKGTKVEKQKGMKWKETSSCFPAPAGC